MRASGSVSDVPAAGGGSQAHRRFCVAAAVAASTLLSAASVAPAQREIQTGSHIPTPAPADIPDDIHLPPVERARITTIAFGQCTVLRHRRAVDEALALPPTDPKRGRALHSIASSECLRIGQLQMPQNVMIGALYQALYRADFAKAQPALAATRIDYSQDIASAAGAAEAGNYVALRQFGECVIRTDPANSRALMLAPIAGSSETAAFTALADSFSGCIGPGQTIRFSKAIVAGLIAETLYRESKAAPPSSFAEK